MPPPGGMRPSFCISGCFQMNAWICLHRIDGCVVHIFLMRWHCAHSLCRLAVNVHTFEDYRNWNAHDENFHACSGHYLSFLSAAGYYCPFHHSFHSSRFISMTQRTGLVCVFEEPEWAVIICTGLRVVVSQAGPSKSGCSLNKEAL